MWKAGIVSPRAVMWVLALMLAIGAYATWRAVGALEESFEDLLVVQTRIGNIDRVVDATVDAADGRQDVVFSIQPGEDRVVKQLDDIFFHTGYRSEREDLLLDGLQLMVDSVESSGRVDERTVTGFENVYLDLRDDLLEPTGDEVESARNTVRWVGWIVALVAAGSLILGFVVTRPRST